MLSLDKITGAAEVHLHRSFRFARFRASGRGRRQLPPLRQRGAFLYLEEGTGHVSRVGTPLNTTKAHHVNDFLEDLLT